MAIAIFISDFGKTYAEVLGKTFFSSDQLARDFISKMKKKGLVELKKTGLIKPKNEIRLTANIKKDLKKIGFKITDPRSSIRKLNHNMVEQMAYFWLGKIGKIERKSIWHHKNVFHVVPDLLLRTDTMQIHVEIEVTQKSRNRYKERVLKGAKDKPSSILYITENKQMMQTLARAMPIWDKLSYIDIDTMINNIKHQEKIRPIKQVALLPKTEQERQRIVKRYEHLSAPRKNADVEKTRELSPNAIKENYYNLLESHDYVKQKLNAKIDTLTQKLKEREEELYKLRTRHTQELEDEKAKYSKCIGVLKRLKNRTWWEKLVK
jgi:hypothetical protein